jgi:hypothetical protein
MTTEELLGASPGVFVLVTVFIIGFAAYMTGQALATTWKPVWHLLIYCVLLGGAARFLIFALYEGELWSLSGYVIGTAVLIAIGLFAYRLNRARKMVAQYPWLYQRTGLFGWRDRQQ